MKSVELKVKMDNAQAKVEKTQKTISRYEERIAKKKAEIRSKGWDETDPWCRADTPEHNEAYWMICDYSHLVEDHKNALKKLAEAQRIVESWKEKLNAQKEKEELIANVLPEAFIKCQKMLALQWTDEQMRAKLDMERYRSVTDHAKFRKAYSFKKQEELSKTREEFYEKNKNLAEVFVLDIYNRTKEITGDVIDFTGIHYSGKALNGIVIGKNGTAKVETILAGGYNIQRLHLRVLVHRI